MRVTSCWPLLLNGSHFTVVRVFMRVVYLCDRVCVCVCVRACVRALFGYLLMIAFTAVKGCRFVLENLETWTNGKFNGGRAESRKSG